MSWTSRPPGYTTRDDSRYMPEANLEHINRFLQDLSECSENGGCVLPRPDIKVNDLNHVIISWYLKAHQAIVTYRNGLWSFEFLNNTTLRTTSQGYMNYKTFFEYFKVNQNKLFDELHD